MAVPGPSAMTKPDPTKTVEKRPLPAELQETTRTTALELRNVRTRTLEEKQDSAGVDLRPATSC